MGRKTNGLEKKEEIKTNIAITFKLPLMRQEIKLKLIYVTILVNFVRNMIEKNFRLFFCKLAPHFSFRSKSAEHLI